MAYDQNANSIVGGFPDNIPRVIYKNTSLAIFSIRIADEDRGVGAKAGLRHVRALMRKMGVEALYRKKNTSRRHPGHEVFPYLLRGRTIAEANQVWALDITSVPMARGFVYFVVVMDWATRRILSWRLSTTEKLSEKAGPSL